MIISPHDVSLTSAPLVQQICNPLKTLGINFFNFVRFYNNNTITVLTTNPEWHYHFLVTQTLGSFQAKNFKSGIYLWSDFMPSQILNDATQFNLNNLIQFQESYQSYCDFYTYGTETKNSSTFAFYLNNLEILKKFNQYFLKQAQDLFSTVDKKRLIIPTELIKPQNQDLLCLPSLGNVQKEFERELFIKQMDQQHKLALTKQEFACLRELAKGIPVKEVARVLNISYRTVEKHLENARKRYNGISKTQLIKKYHNFLGY